MSEEITQQLVVGIKQILARLDSMNDRISKLEVTVDQRLHETRPIWEAVLVRLDAIELRLASVEEGLSALEARQQALEAGQRSLEAGQQAIEARLDAIEIQLSNVEQELKSARRESTAFLRRVANVSDDLMDLQERVEKLEPATT